MEDFEAALHHANPSLRAPILDEIHFRLLKIGFRYMAEFLQKQQPPGSKKQKTLGGGIVGASLASLEEEGDGDVEGGDVEGGDGESADEVEAEEVPEEEEEEEEEGTGSQDDEASADASVAAVPETMDGGDVPMPMDLAEGQAPVAMFIEDHWWHHRIKRTTWENTVCSVLLREATVHDIPNLPRILETLCHSEVVVDPPTGRVALLNGLAWRKAARPGETYPTLPFADKLAILIFLIHRCVLCSRTLRAYLDQSVTLSTAFRRERRDVEAALKEVGDALKAWEGKYGVRPEVVAASAAKVVVQGEGEAEPGEGEEGVPAAVEGGEGEVVAEEEKEVSSAMDVDVVPAVDADGSQTEEEEEGEPADEYEARMYV